jgi:hypothetical protein
MNKSGYLPILAKLERLENKEEPVSAAVITDLESQLLPASEKAWESYDQHRDGSGDFFGLWEDGVRNRVKALKSQISSS